MGLGWRTSYAATALLAAGGSGEPVELVVIEDPRVSESSGLAVSRLHPGVLWTHNDSGGDAQLFAVGPAGQTVAVLTLGGLEPRDWEALAPATDAAGRPALLVGDIGDNGASRERGVLVHLVSEPAELEDTTVVPAEVTSYRLTYPDGPRDAEGLAVDPRTGRVIVVSKEIFGGGVYATPRPLTELDPSQPVPLERVGEAPGIATDAAALPDGSLVVRTYSWAVVLVPAGTAVTAFALPPAEQGESLAVTPDARSLLVGSEGARSPVWQVPLPAEAVLPEAPAAPEVPAAPTGAVASPGAVASGGGGVPALGWSDLPPVARMGLALAGLGSALALLGWWRRPRRQR